jgi:hypothetical protein
MGRSHGGRPAMPKLVLADDSLRMATMHRQKCYEWRGHASTKPCFKHPNCFRKASTQALAHVLWWHGRVDAEAPLCKSCMGLARNHIVCIVVGNFQLCSLNVPTGFMYQLTTHLGVGSVASQNSGLSGLRPGYTEITETDPTKLRMWSGTEVFRAVDAIAAASAAVSAGTMTRAKFDDLQMVYGLRHNPLSLLSDRALRPFWDPVAVMRWDWVHNTLSNGVLTTEASLLLKACDAFVSRRDIETFLADKSWRFCKTHEAKCKQLHRVFSHWRVSHESPDKLNVAASELLSLFGLLRYFIRTRVPATPELADKIASFEACCAFVDSMLACKRGLVPPSAGAAQVRRLASAALSAHIQAYGTETVRPKAHWNLDVADQLLADGVVIDMFIVERRHLEVKQIADRCTNTARFERTVLARLLAETTAPAFGGPHQLFGKVQQLASGTFASDRLRSYGLEVHVGDVVCHRAGCGRVALCILQGRDLSVAVELFAGGAVDKWRRTAVVQLWNARLVQSALAWQDLPDGSILVVRG